MDKSTLNNQIVFMRKIVTKAKVFVIRRLIRKIRKLKALNVEGNKSLDKISDEMHSLKHLNVDDISKYALCNDVSLDCCLKLISNGSLPLEIRSIAKVISVKCLQDTIEKFKSDYPSWKSEVPLILSVLGVLRKKKKKKPTPNLKSMSNLGRRKTETNEISDDDTNYSVPNDELFEPSIDEKRKHESGIEIDSDNSESSNKNGTLQSAEDEKSVKVSVKPTSSTEPPKFCENSVKLRSSKVDIPALKTASNITTPSNDKKYTNNKVIKNYDLDRLVSISNKPQVQLKPIEETSTSVANFEPTKFSSLVRDNLKQLKVNLDRSQLEKSEGTVEVKSLNLDEIDDSTFFIPTSHGNVNLDSGKALLDPTDDFFMSAEDENNEMCSNVLVRKSNSQIEGRRFNPNYRAHVGTKNFQLKFSRSAKPLNYQKQQFSRVNSNANEDKLTLNRKMKRALAKRGYDPKNFDTAEEDLKRKLISEIRPSKTGKIKIRHDASVLIPESLHPSWQAKKRIKDSQFQINQFQGKKITFDD